MSNRKQKHPKPLDLTAFFCARGLIILARTGKSLHKIAQAMCTLSLLFYRLSRGKTMPRFTGDNIRFTNATVKTLVVPEGKKGKL